MIKDHKNIIWLASYPKSGNTWFRAFLSALFSENDEISINKLVADYSVANARVFEELTNLNASELYLEEIDELKPEVSRQFASGYQKKVYFKIHEKFYYLPNGKPIIPLDKTKAIIYIVRNPLDVVVSFAHHDNLPIDRVIERLQEDYILGLWPIKEFYPIHERIGSWSGHISSWIDELKNVRIEVIRYEDLHLKPLETFSRALNAVDEQFSEQKIKNAVLNSNFELLKHQEQTNKFHEKSPVSKNFFRKGTIGSWREKLNDKQVDRIISSNKTMMKRLGYLTTEGNLVF